MLNPLQQINQLLQVVDKTFDIKRYYTEGSGKDIYDFATKAASVNRSMYELIEIFILERARSELLPLLQTSEAKLEMKKVIDTWVEKNFEWSKGGEALELPGFSYTETLKTMMKNEYVTIGELFFSDIATKNPTTQFPAWYKKGHTTVALSSDEIRAHAIDFFSRISCEVATQIVRENHSGKLVQEMIDAKFKECYICPTCKVCPDCPKCAACPACVANEKVCPATMVDEYGMMKAFGIVVSVVAVIFIGLFIYEKRKRGV